MLGEKEAEDSGKGEGEFRLHSKTVFKFGFRGGTHKRPPSPRAPPHLVLFQACPFYGMKYCFSTAARRGWCGTLKDC